MVECYGSRDILCGHGGSVDGCALAVPLLPPREKRGSEIYEKVVLSAARSK